MTPSELEILDVHQLFVSLDVQCECYSAEVLILLSIERCLLIDPRFDIRCDPVLVLDRLNHKSTHAESHRKVLCGDDFIFSTKLVLLVK